MLALSTANAVHALGVTALITMGNSPGRVVYDSGKDEIFVTNEGDNIVSVISDNTNAVIANVTFGNGPESLAYDSAKGRIFVTNGGSNTVSTISDPSSPSVSPLPTATIPEIQALIIPLPLIVIASVGLYFKKHKHWKRNMFDNNIS